MASVSSSAPKLTVGRRGPAAVDPRLKLHQSRLTVRAGSDAEETRSNLKAMLPVYLEGVMGPELFRTYSNTNNMEAFVDALADGILDQADLCGEENLVSSGIKFMDRPAYSPEFADFICEVVKDVRITPGGDQQRFKKNAALAAGKLWHSIRSLLISKKKQREIEEREARESASRNATTGQRA